MKLDILHPNFVPPLRQCRNLYHNLHHQRARPSIREEFFVSVARFAAFVQSKRYASDGVGNKEFEDVAEEVEESCAQGPWGIAVIGWGWRGSGGFGLEMF